MSGVARCCFTICSYTRALAEAQRSGPCDSFFVQLLLVPFYTGCARLCQLLFHPDFAECVRAITARDEKEVSCVWIEEKLQLLLPVSYMSAHVTTAIADVQLVLAYVHALKAQTLVASRNPLMHRLVTDWLRANSTSTTLPANVSAAIRDTI